MAESSFGLSIDMFPAASVLVDDFDNLSVDVRSYKEPLKRSVQKVISPAIRDNFDSEGGAVGGWTPLTDATVMQREYYGFSAGPILDRTGTLKKAAQQLNIWHIDTEQATLDNMPSRVAAYAFIQQFGGIGGRGAFIPARPFLAITEDEVDAIVGVFQDWLGERLAARGFR